MIKDINCLKKIWIKIFYFIILIILLCLFLSCNSMIISNFTLNAIYVRLFFSQNIVFWNLNIYQMISSKNIHIYVFYVTTIAFKCKANLSYLMLSSSTNIMTPLALCFELSRSIILSKSSVLAFLRIFSLTATQMLYSPARAMKLAMPWK